MGVGYKIKRLREEKKLSQEALAGMLDISQSRLCNLENGRTEKIDVLLIDKVCNIFDKDLQYFLEDGISQTNNDQSVGSIYSNSTVYNYPENILEQVKLLIKDNKQKDAQIKTLEQKLSNLG